MDEKEDVTSEVPEEIKTEPVEEQNGDNLRMGYIVGVTNAGNFVFEVLGENKGLVELLGLHAHATAKIQGVYERAQMTGDALIHEVGKALTILNKKLDQILDSNTSKKTDNEI